MIGSPHFDLKFKFYDPKSSLGTPLEVWNHQTWCFQCAETSNVTLPNNDLKIKLGVCFPMSGTYHLAVSNDRSNPNRRFQCPKNIKFGVSKVWKHKFRCVRSPVTLHSAFPMSDRSNLVFPMSENSNLVYPMTGHIKFDVSNAQEYLRWCCQPKETSKLPMAENINTCVCNARKLPIRSFRCPEISYWVFPMTRHITFSGSNLWKHHMRCFEPFGNIKFSVSTVQKHQIHCF